MGDVVGLSLSLFTLHKWHGLYRGVSVWTIQLIVILLVILKVNF